MVYPPIDAEVARLSRSPRSRSPRSRSLRSVWRRSLLAVSLCGLAITSCGAVPNAALQDEAGASAEMEMAAAPTAADAASNAAPQAPPQSPQLIKTAQLSLTVEDMDAAIAQVNQILTQQQGYTLNLNDTEPSGARVITQEIRVPQERLDKTLDALVAIGTLQGRSISSQDVSDQLVDLDARLRNLRRTEASLLALLERSGSIQDILAVNQEISSVRQQIEQLDAQQKNLRTRVAYSTITLTLTQNAANLGDPTPSAVIQLQRTWTTSTRSLRDLTVDLLQLGLWLLIYTPYWVLLGAGVWAGRRWWRSRRSRPQSTLPSPKQ